MTYHVRVLAGSLSPTAGSHIYNRELIRRLCERGHRVSVVCLDDGDESWDPADVTVLPRRDWSGVPGAWRLAVPLQASSSRRQLAAARLDRPDVTIATEHLFARQHARRFPGVPWVYLPHSLVVGHEIDSYAMTGVQRRLARRFYVREQRWALRNAAAVVRFNRLAAQALIDEYGREALRAPLLVNPPGIPVPEVPFERVAPRPDRLRMLFVGRLAAAKNVDLILRSLAAHRGRAWELDVLGDGPDRAVLEEATGRLGLTEQVRFRGHQAQPERFYREADLFVFPSKLESMGLAVLEAMAQGVPALAVRGDGDRYRVPFSDVIDDGVNGLLARDEADFQSRLAGAIAEPSIARRLGPAAQQTARDRYSWPRHIERYEEAFDELVPAACASRARVAGRFGR